MNHSTVVDTSIFIQARFLWQVHGVSYMHYMLPGPFFCLLDLSLSALSCTKVLCKECCASAKRLIWSSWKATGSCGCKHEVKQWSTSMHHVSMGNCGLTWTPLPGLQPCNMDLHPLRQHHSTHQTFRLRTWYYSTWAHSCSDTLPHIWILEIVHCSKNGSIKKGNSAVREAGSRPSV